MQSAGEARGYMCGEASQRSPARGPFAGEEGVVASRVGGAHVFVEAFAANLMREKRGMTWPGSGKEEAARRQLGPNDVCCYVGMQCARAI